MGTQCKVNNTYFAYNAIVRYLVLYDDMISCYVILSNMF